MSRCCACCVATWPPLGKRPYVHICTHLNIALSAVGYIPRAIGSPAMGAAQRIKTTNMECTATESLQSFGKRTRNHAKKHFSQHRQSTLPASFVANDLIPTTRNACTAVYHDPRTVAPICSCCRSRSRRIYNSTKQISYTWKAPV